MARFLRGVAAIALVAACGCGSKSAPPAAPSSGSEASPSSPSPSSDTATPAAPDAPPPGDDTPLTEPDCARLINHIIDIGLETQRQIHPADPVPDEKEVAAIRDQMVHKMTPQCLQFDRASWRCAITARTAPEVTACIEAEPDQPAAPAEAAPRSTDTPVESKKPSKKPAKK